MTARDIAIHTGEVQEFEAFLAQRIYEYNAAATGYHDGELFAAIREGESGNVEAGASGYTWGGCCYVSNLWVSENLRGRGIGSELLQAVESHAREKRCRFVFLSSHSFQAAEFYARRGYRRVAQVDDHPVGHANIFFAKLVSSDACVSVPD
jgi:N-acetylglutamate synthase-like GNAT family acetyltransferase